MNRFELWSRRKRGLPVEQDSVEDAPLPESAGEDVDHGQPTLHEEPSEPHRHFEHDDEPHSASPPEGSLDHTLPDPDTLGPGSDFKAYLAPGVSSALKNRALRRLWATGNYNVRDGLDDYDLDYSQMRKMTAETGETVRQWGKKLLDKLEEPAAETPTEAAGSDPSSTSCEPGESTQSSPSAKHDAAAPDASKQPETSTQETSQAER